MASLKDKVPPHNLEAEQAALGALLLDWDAVGTAIRFLRPERFYSLQNQKIFAAILKLYNEGVRGDLITLIEKLRSEGELEAAGGPAYITSLTDTVATSANIEYYAQIVFDQAIRRDLIRISAEVVAQSHNETVGSRAVLEDAQRKIFELTDLNTVHSSVSIQDLVTDAIDRIQKLYADKKAYTGIPSGLTDLDKLTSGFQPSELVIIGARPSIGKTAMALSMVQHIAISNKVCTAFFSLEMSNMQIIMRLLAQESGIASERIRTGYLRQSDFSKLQDAAGKIYDAPLYIVDTPNMKLLDLRAMARRLRAQKKVEIIFIDYITLIQSENTLIPRHEQIAEISRSLKSLARELGIPVVVLSQVRRDAENKQPNLSDLRESGSIEQDADVVMFIHRDRTDKKEASDDDTEKGIETELILAKQRNGPTGLVKILFQPTYTRFVNADFSEHR
ncbi:replicative DNA helicase [Treponema sp. OMZ 840]|uniref:replicative DNA helicase n=1 Tax=Treponema sp. OMZ 840 TaxID=244313 RepID=UPI003D8B61CB